MEYYPKIEQFVIEAFTKSHNPKDIKHFERTVYWLKQLRPEADEALCIAAFAHDTERAFRESSSHPAAGSSPKGFRDEEFLTYHQNKGAEIIADFLKQQNAPQEMTDRVQMLISKHEVGGNEDQNLLKDADSVSYFENQMNHFLTEKVAAVGKEKVREKFQWMFDRITSGKAKDLARPMFEDAITKLG
ncbi:MAG: DUF4202 family protein [Candidatus Doudnabacteria bacterium]|nr:DUF4202 family protein [Candidatus Doudnabacteria bacterium]